MQLFSKVIFLFFLVSMITSCGQKAPSNYFKEKQGANGILRDKSIREIRYRPDGESFVIENGKKRFNRSLYGGNSQFRVLAGDVPEFLLFGNGKDGVMRLGIINQNQSKWLVDAESVETRYIPGKMIYIIQDELLGDGKLVLTVLAAHNSESMLVEVQSENVKDVQLFTLFGAPSSRNFHRNGDLNTESDPDIYYLNAKECEGDQYDVNSNSFTVRYQSRKNRIKNIEGIFPESSQLKIVDASVQSSPLESMQSGASDLPALASQIELGGQNDYFALEIKKSDQDYILKNDLSKEFEYAEKLRKSIADRMQLTTPDPFFNTLGAVWTTASDGCWQDPTWLHGASGWRVRLNGWRVEYLGDVLGWHDRARMNFNAYNKSQVTEMNKQLVLPGEKENLSREAKSWESILYSSGYICPSPNGEKKMKHYDMNLVYIDALLWHLKWTGDLEYAKEVWPVLERHLDWEKRCFDPDDDGLYNAYCCIWASDALEYTGSGVAHSTSYNYRSNLLAAELAKFIGKDGRKYAAEAEKIKNAMQENLWLDHKGTFAEFQDALGNQLMHESPAIWTVYHSIDNNVADDIQEYLMTRYVDNEIPHFNLIGNDETEHLSTISTSNWHPYIWSVNNVAFAEVAHMALAYWQAGRKEAAFDLFKANIMDFMYMGSTPGNIGQISYYDAARGEVYSDFSDPAGIGARALMEGLYGIVPDALNGWLTIKPGFPDDWKHAAIKTPDIDYKYAWNEMTEEFTIAQTFPKAMKLALEIPAKYDEISKITINGEDASWEMTKAIGSPIVKIQSDKIEDQYKVQIQWAGKPFKQLLLPEKEIVNEITKINVSEFNILDLEDPQGVVKSFEINDNLSVKWNATPGKYSIFVELEQNGFSWWQPIEVELVKPIVIKAYANQKADEIAFYVENNSNRSLRSSVMWVNGNSQNTKLKLTPNSKSKKVVVKNNLVAGTNKIEIVIAGTKYVGEVLNWNIKNESLAETVSISDYYNARAEDIYKQEYLSPRPDVLTLQQPKHGYGNWCNYDVHPTLSAESFSSKNSLIELANNVNFNVDGSSQNIAYTSMYDNYPAQIEIPLSGAAKHAYLLMTGSTNHMQSRVVNGVVTIHYQDGSSEELKLINPDNWWSIEQDMHIDDFAFAMEKPSPLRISLKTGEAYTVGKGLGVQNLIDGGMASVLDLPLDETKELSHLTVKTIANEVVVGVMAVSLIR